MSYFTDFRAQAYSSDSEVSSPDLQSRCSESENFDTPSTNGSVLFDQLDDADFAVREPIDEKYILVVGGCGYIGSHTVWELAKAGYNVVVIDNLSNAFRSVFERIGSMVNQHYELQKHRQPCLRLHEADFRDQQAITNILEEYAASPIYDKEYPGMIQQRCSNITGVIHFAAYKAVEESIRQPLKYYANNVGGLISFCSLLGNFGIKRIVFSSSATVYGTVADRGIPLREEYCSQKTISFVDHNGADTTVEAGCTGLTNPYGRTKWMCEAILSDLAHSDSEWSITALRYFNPIGCDKSGLLGEDPRLCATNLMPVVLRVLSGVMPILNIYGDDYNTPDGTAVRDYIHVTDLALGHVAALKSKPSSGFSVYNLGSGRGHSVLEVVAAVEGVFQRKVPTQLVSRRPGDVGSCVARSSKAEEELGWKAERGLITCCQDIHRYLTLAEKAGNMI
ncbi:hypothetical protein BJ878DRAFT_287929 [Calycina marina]|uniref:NAD(P)-binding domain-containing protein n=1 Tax=Calycina marina TaxID=1763456 RepID=A0A9P8CIV5_9HELO|nr:hypothetical protein BJ878DRAFT_287929 [Calycina marina]